MSEPLLFSSSAKSFPSCVQLRHGDYFEKRDWGSNIWNLGLCLMFIRKPRQTLLWEKKGSFQKENKKKKEWKTRPAIAILNFLPLRMKWKECAKVERDAKDLMDTGVRYTTFGWNERQLRKTARRLTCNRARLTHKMKYDESDCGTHASIANWEKRSPHRIDNLHLKTRQGYSGKDWNWMHRWVMARWIEMAKLDSDFD